MIRRWLTKFVDERIRATVTAAQLSEIEKVAKEKRRELWSAESWVQDFKRTLEDEDFIDEVVQRIKRKQL